MRVDAGTTDVVDEVKSLASHWSSPAKRAVLNRKLVTLRTKHISKAFLFPGQVSGDINYHIEAVKGLLEAGNDLHRPCRPSLCLWNAGVGPGRARAAEYRSQRGDVQLERNNENVSRAASQVCKNLSRGRRRCCAPLPMCAAPCSCGRPRPSVSRS